MKNRLMTLGALVLVGSACNPVVTEALQDAQTADTPVVPGTKGSGVTAPGGTALAMRAGDINWQDNFSPSPVSGAPWSNPDSLVVFLSNTAQQCGNPVVAKQCTGDTPIWQFIVVIPPELDHPGPIDLVDHRIMIESFLSAPDGTPMCGGGGGYGTGTDEPGTTLEILGRTSTSVSLQLSGGVHPFGLTSTIDGVYSATTCGAPAPASPPTAALTLRGADLPAGPAGGPAPEPDALVVFLGTLPDTCADPWAAADCGAAGRLSFTLPLALQKPGVISLSDPAVAATHTGSATSGSTECGAPGGPLTEGTIEIVSVDAGGLVIKVHDSCTSWADLVCVDGLYAASICP